MNAIDILVLLGVIFFALLGVRDGFFKKVYGVIGFWVGLIVASNFMYPLGATFNEWFGLSKEMSHIVAFCSMFFLFVILENVIFRLVGKPGHDTLNAWTRIGGAFIGTIQGLLAMSLLLIMFSIVRLPLDRIRDASNFYKAVFHIAPQAFDLTTGLFGDSRGFLEMLQDNFRNIKLP